MGFFDDAVDVLSPVNGVINHALGGNGYDTVSQGPLETPEQRAARQLLLNYAKNGRIGDITAGEDIGLPTGSYDMTGLEKTGLNNLQSLIAGGIPSQFAVGDSALNDLLDTSEAGLDRMFNPYKN